MGQESADSFILYSNLTAQNADAEIAAQVAYFRALGHTVEWKTYRHDAPPDLLSRLVSAGFTPEDEETLVAFDLHNTSLPAVPPHITVRRLSTPDEVDAVAHVQNTVWGEDHLPWLADWLRDKLAEAPTSVSVFAAVPHGQNTAQGVGWITYDESPFAGLWGGTTMPEHRGQGLYRALVTARLTEAQTRGVRFATVDALPTSRPILERLGFVRLTETRPCVLTAPPEKGDACSSSSTSEKTVDNAAVQL